MTRLEARAALYSIPARAEAKRQRRLTWQRGWEARIAEGTIPPGTCRGDLSPFDPTKPRALGCRRDT